MRCRNCGWNNPADAVTCEKCHSKLTGFQSPNRPRAARPGDSRSLGQTPTVMGRPGMPDLGSAKPFGTGQSASASSSPRSAGMQIVDTSHRPGMCPDCGYPVSEKADSCPNCGYDFSKFAKPEEKKEKKEEPKAYAGTVLSKNPFSNFATLEGNFSLQPVDEEGNPYDEPLIFSDGDIIVLGNERFLFSSK